ncbi:unnamed protein product [Rotaria socialis]|uniref:glucan endo-1,3-beta-D-glucosidase n=2 Tax=Rotaria socialis TaxID=392032 RepID=A0A818H6V0_9BILA|nr:unnamed protein product [Rotaria socialis]
MVMNLLSSLVLIIVLCKTVSIDVLVPLSTNVPDSTLYPHVIHPRQPKRLNLSIHAPLHTNKFYSNAILGDYGNNPLLTHPYVISMSKDSPYGVSISLTEEWSYGPQIDSTRVKYFINRIVKNIQMSALEFLSQQFEVNNVDEPGFACTIKMFQSNSSATITLPLVRGMAYVTFEFVFATPRISTIHSILSVNGRTSGNITGKRFEIVLNNNQAWLLYALDGEITLEFSGNQLIGTNPVTNVLRLAKKQAEPSANAVLDAQVGVYPIACQLEARVTGFQGSYMFKWQRKGNLSKTLLHFTFPHHRSIISLVDGQFTNVEAMSASKGRMIGYLGNIWTLTENALSTMQFLAPHSPAIQYRNLIVTQLKKDLAVGANLTVSDYYFTGKEFHKYALLCLLADYYREIAEFNRCIKTLKDGFEGLITRKNANALRYDTTWSGLVSSAGLGQNQELNDFGNSYYNDHHYHWGYFIQAGAIIAHLDPNYVSKIRDWVEGLIRDASNPSSLDTSFPQFRYFDWFSGHSWSQGLFESADGKDQESTSEEINFHYGIALWGLATKSSTIEGLGRLMLGTAKRAIQTYFLMNNDNTVMPQQFIANKVTGIFFENKADYTTWFGTNPEFIHGIQMIPCTPITEEIRLVKFVEEEWVTILSKIVHNAVPEWKSLLYMNYAIINRHEAFIQLTNVSLDNGVSRTWALYWAATRPSTNDSNGTVSTRKPDLSTVSTTNTASSYTSTMVASALIQLLLTIIASKTPAMLI